MRATRVFSSRGRPGLLGPLLLVGLALALGSAEATDQGPRRHAQGQFDRASGIYVVAEGDDLIAIGERLEVPAAALKAANQIEGDLLRVGQRLHVVAGAPEVAASGGVKITGVQGAPDATTTISGAQLPPPDPKFGGVIKSDALQSKPWWAPRVVPLQDAPNVLLIITDDAGFGVPSTFGGVIPTPSMDRIANEGLRYNRVFSTALCSPTRAALITGRNHHSAGFGVISEQSTGFPGYNSIIGKDKATIGRILLDNGYATSWFGKDHNVPAFAASQIGPFDQWPTGMGGDYLFIPPGYQGTVPETGYHLARPRTNRLLMFYRAFVETGDIAAAVEGVKAKAAIFPLAESGNPPATQCVNVHSALRYQGCQTESAKPAFWG